MGNQSINKFKWSLFGVSLLLGAMLTIQITSNKQNQNDFRADIITVKSSLAYEMKHQEQLLENIAEMKKKIASYQNSTGNREEVLGKMKTDYEKSKIEAGLTEIQGNGLRIEIRDNTLFSASPYSRFGPHPEDFHIYDEELLYLVNILHANGAQALAVNGQRIVSTTGIREVGVSQQDGTIYPGVMQANLTPIRFPYIIEAVGDIDKMKGALSSYIGNYFISKGADMVVETRNGNNLTVPAYKGSLNFIYATEDKEGVSQP